MELTNTTDHDIIYNSDSGGSIKGHQFRTPIRANEHADISIIQMFMLMLNSNVQNDIADGTITAVYADWRDFWMCILTLALLNGTL